MLENTIDLIAVLESPSEEFLPRAFREVIGREPDMGGLLHYIERLKKGLPRELVLAEMRHSAEGQERSFIARSTELDALHTRYLKLRDLPLGKLRWKRLPRLSKRNHGDARFDWTNWINTFIDSQVDLRGIRPYEVRKYGSATENKLSNFDHKFQEEFRTRGYASHLTSKASEKRSNLFEWLKKHELPLSFMPLDQLPEEILIDEETISYYKPEELLILTTGTQGEAMSALSRISVDDHKYIKIKPGDLVLMSSKFIPGNEKAISKIINNLYKRGAEVYYENISAIHVSGHASKEELKLMMNIVKPKYFIPVHGELRHLYQHKKLAINSGIPSSDVFVIENGNTLVFTEDQECYLDESVYAGRIFVDGKGIGDVGAHTLKERAHLSENGMIIVQLVVDSNTSNIIFGPEIVSKGFVFEDYFKDLSNVLYQLVMHVIEENQKHKSIDWVKVKDDIRRALKKYLNKTIDRHPFIFPMITEI